MKAIHKKRLLKLAAHLRAGKLGHQRFDFRHVNADELGNEKCSGGCSFAGCAWGEAAIAFPNNFTFYMGQPLLRGFDKKKLTRPTTFSFAWKNAVVQAQVFFGIGYAEVCHLFAPEGQTPRKFGGDYLPPYASRKRVADNIEAFVEYHS